jgi:pyruvate/2-oxoglutarate/acetoin dehydrogenase E1 component
MTVAETIKNITREHLSKNHGVALGQCLTAVGWVGGTVPDMKEEEGLVELSMADVAGGGIAVGLALAGRRPIYIVRYQGFQWYNAPTVINYAAKSKEMWGIPCPVFVRSIAMDGGIGPVASGSHHSIFTRMPGIPVAAPMTPKEYESVWQYFMTHDDPIYVSEHRRSFPIDYEMQDIVRDDAAMTIFAISSTRLNAIEAVKTLEAEGIVCNLVHVLWLKPFVCSEKITKPLLSSKFGGLVIDGDFENGVAKTIAFDIIQATGKSVRVLGLEERAAGFAPRFDNLPPSATKITDYVRKIVRA